eukprot:scaffold3243_cov106-Isochrysis_galbana.AAC.2
MRQRVSPDTSGFCVYTGGTCHAARWLRPPPFPKLPPARLAQEPPPASQRLGAPAPPPAPCRPHVTPASPRGTARRSRMPVGVSPRPSSPG